MCSVSWKWHPSTEDSHKLSVYFNRDEQKVRPAALVPKIESLDGTQAILPTDPKRGGTWIAANEHQVVVALLNLYSVKPTPGKDYASRGVLVKALAPCRSSEEAVKQLQQLVKDHLFPAFTVILWDANLRSEQLFQWDEKALRPVINQQPFFTSSSWETKRVQAARTSSFIEQVLHGSIPQDEFHSTTPEGEEWSSVYMQRDVTETVSRTNVYITSTSITMEYKERASDQVHHITIEQMNKVTK